VLEIVLAKLVFALFLILSTPSSNMTLIAMEKIVSKAVVFRLNMLFRDSKIICIIIIVPVAQPD
jgi:hypothetical protein